MIKYIALVACLAFAVAVPIVESQGPTVVAVSDKCDAIFCLSAEKDLVTFDAQNPSKVPTLLTTLVAKEKSKKERQVHTMTQTDGNNLYLYVNDPASSSPLLTTIENKGTGASHSVAVPDLVNVKTMDLIAGNLYFTTASGVILRSSLNGTVEKVDVALPAGKAIGAISTNDGKSRLFFNIYDNDGGDSPMWYIATLDVTTTTMTISVGTPYMSEHSSFGTTFQMDMQYHAGNNDLVSLISDILGPHVGYLNPNNATDFKPAREVLGTLTYLDYTSADLSGVSFLVGDTYYVALSFQDEASTSPQMQMTWVDLSKKYPPLNSVVLPGTFSNFVLV